MRDLLRRARERTEDFLAGRRFYPLAGRYRALEGQNKALRERVAYVEAHNQVLTDTATDLARKLQEKKDLDYQILMTHQQILAGITDTEPGFREIYEQCKPFTMTSAERLYSLYKAVEYVVQRGIQGDIAETGVWRGGSCMLAAMTLLALGDRSRRLFLYDTYEGHPRPDPEKDVDLWGNRGVDDWQRHQQEQPGTGWGAASLEDVTANLARTGYPAEQLVFVKGRVEDTVAQTAPERLALLRLDTDWYESTKASLEHLYPKLASGGVLVVDDYGHYQGQRLAVDEFLAARGERLLLHRIDYSCRVALKP